MDEGISNCEDRAAKPFMCGVCEGFYGKPWNTEQREELFSRMNKMKLNTYMYAPKDDYKHRLYWRDLYSTSEAEELRGLISAAKINHVQLVYALSPGLDIIYSNPADVKLLKDKLDQVRSLGCESYALLFDDIDPDMDAHDEEVYNSVAHAQAALTNNIYEHLGRPSIFLFCPTEYCASRAVPSVQKSEYLQTLGNKLHKSVDILWTGPMVVSREISVESIEEVSKVICRPPVIWDNMHANDYDQSRMFIGPYEGRPTPLLQSLNGVLTNPNCEFELNFIAMHTLAQWGHNTLCNFLVSSGKTGATDQVDINMESEANVAYSPKRALIHALQDWLQVLYQRTSVSAPHEHNAHQTGNDANKDVNCESRMSEDHSQEEDMDSTESGDSPKGRSPGKSCTTKGNNEGDKHENSNDNTSGSSGKSDKKKERPRIDEMEPLNVADLMLLCDFFYTPFEHGTCAVRYVKGAHWLLDHVDCLKDKKDCVLAEQPPKVHEWYCRATEFHHAYKEFGTVIDRLFNVPNRDVLYQLYHYVTDMRTVLGLVNSYIKWYGLCKNNTEQFRSGEQEPWVHRGGLHSEFRRLLPLDGRDDTCPTLHIPEPNGTPTFIIRPYYSSDKGAVYKIACKTCDDGLDGSDIYAGYPDLCGDEHVGAMLQLYPQHVYVLEDDAGVCAYAAAVPDVCKYRARFMEEWIPLMKKKYKKPTTRSNYSTAQKTILSFHRDQPEVPKSLLERFPGLLHMRVLQVRCPGSTTPSKLLHATSRALKEAGANAVHITLQQSHIALATFHLKLDFSEVTDLVVGKKGYKDMLIFGRDF